MITLVRLANWRAYGNVEIQLEPGTTFLIGMNGVGKTSFLEAVRWAFQRSPKSDADFIRKGERSASVDITFQIDGGTARIKRTVSIGTKPKPLKTPVVERESWLNGDVVTEDQLFGRLEEAWGADIGFVTRTAFLDTDISPGASDNELRAHLCRAYNLDTIEDNVRVLDDEIKKAVKDADAEYRAGEDLARQIRSLEAQLGGDQELLRTTEAEADELAREMDTAANAVTQAREAQRTLDERVRWDARWTELADECRDLIGDVPLATDVRPLLQTAHNAASQQLDEIRQSIARVRERTASLQAALATLDAAGGDCPICRRPLDDESRGHAHDAQTADLERAERELEALDASGPSAVASRIQSLLDRTAALGGRPIVVGDAPPDVDAAQAALTDVQDRRDALVGARGATTERISAAQERLMHLQQQARAAAQASAAYRRLAVLTASRDALRATVTEVLNAQLGPIGREISNRWDEVFPDRPGLIVDPEGRLSRTVAGETLEYRSFSVGEQTVARLLLRLATVISTTKVPFCWLDEPLEHLDDKSKLVVARTLAQFGKQRILDQIFVTTFDQSLTSSVAHSSDAPRVEYLGTSQVAS